jgi:hypothetical protein
MQEASEIHISSMNVSADVFFFMLASTWILRLRSKKAFLSRFFDSFFLDQPHRPRCTTRNQNGNGEAQEIRASLTYCLLGAVMKKTALALALVAMFSLSIITGAQLTWFSRANGLQVQTVQSSHINREFNVDVVYVYFQEGNYGNVVFNATRISDLPTSSEGVIEVFEAQIYAGENCVGQKTVGWQIGEGLSMETIMGFTMSLHSFFVTSRTGLTTVSVFYEPVLVEPVHLSVTRLGWITVDGDSIDSDLSGDEFVQDVQLDEFKGGFLFNVLVPAEQLSNIDLYRPWESLDQNSPSPNPSSSPTPTMEPTPTEEALQTLPFEAIVGVTITVAVTGAGLGLLIYLMKRKRLVGNRR